MSDQTNTFRDSTLNFDQAYYYTLLLLVDAETFSYAITYKNKIMAYDAGCDIKELAEPTSLQELLTAPYKKVVVGFIANGFTLVSHEVFKVDHIANFARLLDVKSNEKVLAQVLDEQNYVIYKVDEKLPASISNFNFKTIAFAPKGLIKATTKDNPKDDSLYLNINGDKVEFLYFKDDLLRFYNKFAFKDAVDLVYYAALVTNELQMHPQYTNLMASGDIDLEDALYLRLKEFFTTVVLNKIQLFELPAQLASHKLLSLAALSLCESSEGL